MTNKGQMREEYESKFPKPTETLWNNHKSGYTWSDGYDPQIVEIARQYQYGWEVWQAARAGGESEAGKGCGMAQDGGYECLCGQCTIARPAPAAKVPETERDYFAAKALQGLCANPDLTHTPAVDLGYKAVVYAEAALAELERQNET